MRHASRPRLVSLLPLLLPAWIAVGVQAQQGRSPYLLEHEGRSTEVETHVFGREEYLDVEDLARFFGFTAERTGRKELELRHEGDTVQLRAGRGLIYVGGQPIVLSAEIERKRRSFYVPLDFVTRGIARLLGVEARHDRAARAIRFDAAGRVVTCKRYADRTRVTVQLERAPTFSDIVRDGRRRILELTNQELPGQVGGCLFDETLSDLEVRPTGGRTRLTFFVGPRFANLKVYDLPDQRQLVFDFFNDSSVVELDPTPTRLATPADVFDTIVLDPGHGGEDHGAVGPSGLREKDVTLAVAQHLADLLRERAGMRVVLTRTSDQSVGLVDRTEKANQARGDLFVSIHANATVARQAQGAETYFMSLEATDEAARTLAALENDATGARRRGYSGADIELLFWDMAQQQYLSESSDLAEEIQREMNDLTGARDRGVKQANFLVLRGATMPAVLVEIGFVSNPTEERRLRTLPFQQAAAEALYRAILAFRDRRQARSR